MTYPNMTPEGSDAEMFIQWKGTRLCMDFYCPCGADGHVDAMFAHHVQCHACGAIFQLGTQVIATRVETAESSVLTEP